ncbi:MAG: flagellin [Verrucomicrobia bacterium]|nr:flagellin [Verrucomicrobiota bacterium]
MIIQQKTWELGGLNGADPSSHSFHSQNWHRPGGRKKSPREDERVQDKVVTIGSHPPCRNEYLSVNLNLGSAISFSQTQDAFLKKVQESLVRMNELSDLAQNNTESGNDLRNYGVEFSELQSRIRDLEEKMSAAVNIFEVAAMELTTEVGEVVETEEMATFGRIPIHDFLENSADPSKTVIIDRKTASDASGTIKDALAAITTLRKQVGNHILELCQTGEQLAVEMQLGMESFFGIKDRNGAEENTKTIRSNILAKSGVAMMAQANAVPDSTLRLLG